MSEWQTLSLRQAGVKLIDCDHRTPPAVDFGYPYVAIPQLRNGRIDVGAARCISQEDFAEWTRKANPEPYDVVLSRRCNPGETAFVAPEMRFALGQNLVLLRADGHKIYPPFLRWIVRGSEWWNQVDQFINVGAVFDSLKCADVPKFELSIPPLTQQRAIAHILGTLDDKIELNRRMNETLEAIARAMFKSWFVDFDPVRARISDEPPESICQRLGLTPDLLALFPDRLVDSDLGEIPEGWGVGTIGDHCYLNAKSWSAKTIPEEVYYVDLANVKNGIISEVQIFSSENAPSRARRILRAGDTIVGTVRPGNCSFALIGEGEPQLTGSTGFAVLSPKRKELRELVFFLATSDENIDRLKRLADGAAYPAVRPEVVTAGACIVPAQRVIDTFHAATASMIDYQIANRVNSDVLAALRDALLPKLLSGELRVKGAIEESIA